MKCIKKHGMRGGLFFIKKGLLASEAIAHMTEAVCSGNKRIKPMEKFLPDTWNYFIRNIRRLLK